MDYSSYSEQLLFMFLWHLGSPKVLYEDSIKHVYKHLHLGMSPALLLLKDWAVIVTWIKYLPLDVRYLNSPQLQLDQV